MIDRQLNYGRNNIAAFLRKVAPFDSIVDLGAGGGSDLALVMEICPQARRIAIEAYPPNVEKLKQQSRGVLSQS